MPPPWNVPSDQWVKQCERLIELDGRLANLLAGKPGPANAAERLELAQVCRFKGLNRAAQNGYAVPESVLFSVYTTPLATLKLYVKFPAALLAVNSIIGIGEDQAGQLHLFDGEKLSWRTIRVPADPGCKACGSA